MKLKPGAGGRKPAAGYTGSPPVDAPSIDWAVAEQALVEEQKRRFTRKKLQSDFVYYSPECLKIRTKAGAIASLELNEAQLYLHKRLEDQKQRTGKVRALVLKARQQGISTYIGGRYYWLASHTKGVRVFILTHEQDATNNLFGMVERYHSHCPELVKPITGSANAKELSFAALESDYAVGTAGAKATGRSQTVQLFHGSECAFWPNAETHFADVAARSNVIAIKYLVISKRGPQIAAPGNFRN